jgi:hypothetical protein
MGDGNGFRMEGSAQACWLARSLGWSVLKNKSKKCIEKKGNQQEAILEV